MVRGAQALDLADLIVVLTYFLVIVGVGIFVSTITKRF